MIRSTALLALVPLTTGCIIYDGTWCGKKDRDCSVEGDTAGLTEEGGADTAEEEAPAASFTADPDELLIGSTTIVSLTAENFDLSSVDEVDAYGPIAVIAISNRGDELLLTVVADADALDGDTADLLLTVGDGAEYVDDVFTLRAELSEDGGGDDGGDGSGSDDGSSGGGSGSGGTSGGGADTGGCE
jgi:uncharacterized membrane protein YgcG